MEQDKTPVNFDFINSQQPIQQKKPLDKRVVIIVVLVIMLAVMGLVILLTGNENKNEPSATRDDYVLAENKVKEFLTYIRNQDDTAAYKLLEGDDRISPNFFKKSAQFLRTRVNTQDCVLSNASDLDNGFKLVYNCPLSDGSGPISIEFTLANKKDELLIVRYQQTGIENEI